MLCWSQHCWVVPKYFIWWWQQNLSLFSCANGSSNAAGSTMGQGASGTEVPTSIQAFEVWLGAGNPSY